uniref:tRNA pseudouridine(55) synthase n=1 Tax=Anopheles farauti TaxID=69004 RepID=A0A182Q9H7_9DIPT
MDKQKLIYDYLRSVDCCRVCCLRFLKGTKEEFVDIDTALGKRGFEQTHESNGDQEAKKAKENICVACLGLFNLDTIESLASEVKNHASYQQYQCKAGFLTSISLPIVLHLRQLALWFDVLDRFPETFNSGAPPDIAVKDALKTMIIHQLEQKLEKPFSVDGVMVNVPFTYANEQQELNILEQISPGVFANRKANKHTKNEFISRNAFEKHFTPAAINAERFRKHYSVPPVSTEQVGLVRGELSFTGPTIFIAGRYNKFSRTLSQTPWMIDGKRMMEGSVQETIAAAIAPHFGVSDELLIFSSSGREDVDVRCLGEGRPFVLEIPDAKQDQLPEEIAVEMEQQVGNSKQVAIRDLQLVKREDLVHIRGTEDEKRKFYRALCVTTEPVTEEMVRKLRINEPFVMQQVTPLRVLHRRTLLARPRTVYSVRAFACRENPHAMVVDIVSQAGTYIKELVHSDFGRTGPSFRSIIGKAIDIHALDVMAIDLDWPKKIRR